MKKGSITVYMACTLLVMLAFFTSMIEAARVNAMKTKLICTTDLAVDSALAEYCIPMLEQYGLFFVDTAYGQSDGDYQNTAKHLEEYAKKNIHVFYEYEEKLLADELKDLAFREWYGIELSDVELSKGYYATDQNGEVLRQQAIDYMYHYYGMELTTDYLSEIMVNYQKLLENGWDSEENTVEKELSDQQKKIQTMQEQNIEIEDPTQNLTNDKEMVLLNAMMGKLSTSLSNKAINRNLYLSKRGAENEGETPAYQANEITNLTNKLLFDQYILLMCDCFDREESDKLLEYEVEYIIAGKDSDKENLQYVTNRIFLIRELANIEAIMKDREKRRTVMLTAKTLSLGISGVDALIEGVLMAGWAYFESVQDIRDLFQGKKVPLVKAEDDWKTSLDTFLGKETEVRSVDKGLSYQDYLTLLLAVEKEEQKTVRLMDIMEMNIRKDTDYKYFRIDCLIEGFQADFHYEALGKAYTVQKKRVYDTGPVFRN